MISLYRPGHSVLHRLPAGVKLAGLAVLALVLSLWRPGVIGAPAMLVAVSLLYPLNGLGWSLLGRSWWRLKWLILILGVALWFFVGVEEAVQNTGRVVTLILLAELVTCTTRMGDLLDVLRRLMRPLRFIGIDPESAALAVSLTIAMIPVLMSFLQQVRDAQRARGVRLGLRAALPLLVMTMRHADDVGDALAARGIAG